MYIQLGINIVSYCIVSYRIVSYRIVSYRIVSYRIVSYRIVSYRIVSYRIVSYHIVSYVPEGMELMTYTRHHPDDGNTREVNAVDMVPMCRNVSGITRCELEDSSDMSRTDTAELEESDSEDFCLWTDLCDEEDSPVSNAGSIVDNSLCVSIWDNLSSVDVASMGNIDSEDFDDAISFDSDKGSVAELEWNTWDDACAWEFQNASGDFPILYRYMSHAI